MLAEVTGQKHAFPLVLLSLGTLILSLQLTLYGQPNYRKNINRNEFFGGIEIGTKSIKAIVIQRTEPDGKIKIVFNEVINKNLAELKAGKLTPEAIQNISQNVETLYRRMLQQIKMPAEQLYIIGCADLKAFDTGELTKIITEKTGRKLTLLDLQTEAIGALARLLATDCGDWRGLLEEGQ